MVNNIPFTVYFLIIFYAFLFLKWWRKRCNDNFGTEEDIVMTIPNQSNHQPFVIVIPNDLENQITFPIEVPSADLPPSYNDVENDDQPPSYAEFMGR
ncbi:hypothetical protein PVAND_001745 [Polypedilum vanderplanki]|uniref:Uncharacterized protein n=1 Tax=Polypedilum vanderplanki TaxID=319348 RepID=A0A9J6BPB0_POLVA|nr:hypothetical protein PVAND_001745 [Polypedilum vanderplanki]